MSLIKLKDGITPALKKQARALNSAGRTRLLTAMGQSVKAMGVQAFTQPGLRPSVWAKRKDDLPHALLQKSTTLRKSIRITSVTAKEVTIGSDRAYASTHQRGSKQLGIPARPFLPFYKNGRMTKLGTVRVERALRSGLKVAGL